LIHIPYRIFEGYGPNVDAVRGLADKGATLLVTVDCGTTSLEPLAEARKLGMSVVVIDHHQCSDELPEVEALINPNRPDDLSGLGHLAAVGLVFITLVALTRELRQRNFWTVLRGEPDLLSLLHLVALGTVADVVPLTGLNRAFVAKGLIALRRRDQIGLTALMDASRLSGPPVAWHLGFLLGPRINAGGRIGRADLGVRLLLEEDPSEAARIAAELDRLNRERQQIEIATVAQAEAEAMAALGLEEKGAVVVNNVSEFECHGEIVEYDPPRVLAYTWIANWHDDVTRRTIVRWELTPKSTGTLVKVTHSGLTQLPIACRDYTGGWPGVLEMLKKFAEDKNS